MRDRLAGENFRGASKPAIDIQSIASVSFFSVHNPAKSVVGHRLRMHDCDVSA